MSIYENLSLKNIRGEVWRSVPGYEGYYEVSNKGRVKSLPRIASRNLIHGPVSYYTPERILKQNVLESYNTFLKANSYKCYVHFKVGDHLENWLVHRLVYAVFVGAVDFEKDKLAVLHFSGDTRDNRVENLYLGNLSKKQKQTYAHGKLKTDISKLATPESLERSAKISRKPVTQYKLSGKRVRIYKSRTDAAKAVGLATPTHISDAVLNSNKQVRGFRWIDGKGPAFMNFDIA
jgi:hypothetical protein